jgi:hypothetical protein
MSWFQGEAQPYPIHDAAIELNADDGLMDRFMKTDYQAPYVADAV